MQQPGIKTTSHVHCMSNRLCVCVYGIPNGQFLNLQIFESILLRQLHKIEETIASRDGSVKRYSYKDGSDGNKYSGHPYTSHTQSDTHAHTHTVRL